MVKFSQPVKGYLNLSRIKYNYPRIEYSGADFIEDTIRILADLETGPLI